MNEIRELSPAWLTITMLALCFCLAASAEADVWQDDFTGEALKAAWTPMSLHFVWEVQDGFLHVKHIIPDIVPLERLELTAFPGPHQQFTITATNLKTIRSAGFGIALGKSFPPPPEAPPGTPWSPQYYVFLTHSIYDRIIAGKGGSSGPFHDWVPRHPGTIWDTRELKEMKLNFNVGRFQMFADGELRADFVDDHFDQIELISIVMWGGERVGAEGAEGWMDTFTISAPSLAVAPRGKLATTWGKLKVNR